MHFGEEEVGVGTEDAWMMRKFCGVLMRECLWYYEDGREEF